MYQIAIWRKHSVKGFVEVGVREDTNYLRAVHFYLVQKRSIRSIYGKTEITDQELKKIRSAENTNKGVFSDDVCAVSRCRNPIGGFDRGVPLCDHHYEQECNAKDRDVPKYWTFDPIKDCRSQPNLVNILFE